MIHGPDGSFAIFLVNWEVLSAVGVQPSTTKLPELTDPDVMTALFLPQPAKLRQRASGVVARMNAPLVGDKYDQREPREIGSTESWEGRRQVASHGHVK